MSPFGRRKKKNDTPPRPDSLEVFLAERPDVGTSDADIEAVAQADGDRAAEEARMAQYVKSEESFDSNAPRPSPRD